MLFLKRPDPTRVWARVAGFTAARPNRLGCKNELYVIIVTFATRGGGGAKLVEGRGGFVHFKYNEAG